MGKVWKAAGSKTSADSARLIEPKAGALENAVLELISQSGSRGMADFEIDDRLTESRNGTARPRRCSLRDKGLIADTGQTVKNPETGRRQTRWALTRFVPEHVRMANQKAKDQKLNKAKETVQETVDCPVERELVSMMETASVLRVQWKNPTERGLMMEGPDWIRITSIATIFTRHLERLFRVADERMRRHEEEETGQTGFCFGGNDGREDSSRR